MAATGLPQPLALTRFRRNQYLPRVYGPANVPLVLSCSSGEIGVSESLKQQIDRLQEIYKSELDPQGRAFVPLADAHRQLGDLDKALTVIQEGLGAHPDFASAHIVLGWVHRSRGEPDDAMRAFERVLALDPENTVARTAIAELIEDQRTQAYRNEVAARGLDELSAEAVAEDERPAVPIASLAPDAPVEAVAAPDVEPEPVPSDDRPVIPIASLAPEELDAIIAAPDAAPEAVPDGDDRAVVPIASLAPDEPDAPIAVPGDAPESVSDGGARPVVPIPSLAPEGDEEASDGDEPVGGEIYTQTLGELYATQGAIQEAIEVYRKLIADDPDNDSLRIRLTELESLEPGAEGAPAQLNVRAGLGELVAAPDDRQTVPIESLAPDGTAG